MRTPSLISGSTASPSDSVRTNGLRRKPSTIEEYAASKRAENTKIATNNTAMYTRNEDLEEAFEDSVLGISLPQSTSYVHNGAFVAVNPKYRMPDDLQAYTADQPVTRDITPPVPNYAQSATPSTRYTDSPFSHVPTPSSCSSYSPAVAIVTSGATPRLRQQSPTRNSRPPVSIRPAEKSDSSRLGLPPVRESSTSSSNSTVKPSVRAAAIKEPPRKSATAPPSSKVSETQRPTSRGKLVKERPKQPSSTVTKQQSVQIPPELAHLNVEPPSKLSLNKALPPIRPSRDGTPTLTGMSNPSPVVQSDLPRLYTTYHKRTPSQETPPASSPLKTRFGLSPKGNARHESPRIDSAVSPPPASRAFSRGPTPDHTALDSRSQHPARKDSPAVGPVRSPSKSPRFGFFSRKVKEIPKPVEKPKRQSTKGPAAGTGHEGYGRFGVRGRSGSNTSNTGSGSPNTDSSTGSLPTNRLSTGRKSSVTSKDGSELDDFLRERLNPVVLRGSGSTISNAASNSDVQAPSAPDSSKTSSIESYPKPRLLPSAMSSSAGLSPSKRSLSSSRKPSDSSEDDVTARYPTLAARRSLTRLSQSDERSPVRVPAPIVTGHPSKNSSIDSYDSQSSVWPKRNSTVPPGHPFEDGEGLWLRPTQAEPEIKPSRKWNFFQRAQASPRAKGKAKVGSPVAPRDNVAHSSPYRGLAHYAMLDPVEPVGLEEVERILQENETSPEDSMSEGNGPPKVVPYERRHTSLLPSPPKPEYSLDADFKARPNLPRITVRQDHSESPELLRAQHAIPSHPPHLIDIQRSPIIPEPLADAAHYTGSQRAESQPRQNVHTPDMSQRSLNTPEIQNDNSPQRQPRLSPVGRIPKVVSKRDRDRKLSDSSFSRPFARAQPKPNVKPPGSLYTQIRDLASPIESGSQPVSSTSTRSDGVSAEQKSSLNTDLPSDSTNRTSMDIHANSEFFCLPPRKDSDLSYSSSSGYNSWIAAIAAQPPQQEDIWNEYNDLLDEVMPLRTPLSATSSLGAPFQYSGMLHEPMAYSTKDNASRNFPSALGYVQTSRAPIAPSVLSVPQQIRRYMQPSMSPLSTPNAISDVFDHYGNRSTSTLVSQPRTSIPGPRRSSLAQSTRSSIPGPARSSLPSARGSVGSSRHSRASAHSRSASLPEANARSSQSSLTPSARFNRDTQLLDIAEVEGDEQALASNLRFGALMTSKWLSFGRVLFSPAHTEMSTSEEPRILVIDGLGSDWSYYVALSYPEAHVINLGPNTSPWPGHNQAPPKNHEVNRFADPSVPFPFPRGFFSAVVLRFPQLTTEQSYQSCIFECKRVLQPGGFLEVSVLDLDLMNMGNRARKAVRGLKTRMREKDPNVCLRNLSDVVLRQIGRRGFEEVQRCVVGVPAAGRIPRSQDMSSVSSGHSGKPIWHREDRHSQEFSFADLLEDARASQIGPGKNNDESITKMVAKVGRWWYSSCYEKSLLQSNESSIWNEQGLLRECEKQGTSFRLLICHAQKPTHNRRRTVSV